MINRSKQNWSVGATVKVGFMALKVRAIIATPGDYKPDAYILTNSVGNKLYKFVPHFGLESITVDEARELIDDQRDYETAIEAARAARAREVAEVNAVFA